MALINCPECGKENVSDSAEACPNCGYGIKAHFEKIKQDGEQERQNKLAEMAREEAEKRKEKRINFLLKYKKAFIIIGALVIILAAVSIGMYYKSMQTDITLGMDMDEVIAVLDKHQYEYEVNGDNDTYIINIKNISINNVEGKIYLIIENNILTDVSYLSEITNLNNKDIEKIINTLYHYLEKKYGKCLDGENENLKEINKLFNREAYYFDGNDIKISLSYPINNESSSDCISIGWSLKTEAEKTLPNFWNQK